MICKYGPNLPIFDLISSPVSLSPNTLGSVNKNRASSSLIVSILRFLGIAANRGFSSSSFVPICTKGPNLPILQLISLLVFGSIPSTLICKYSLLSTVSSLCSIVFLKSP